VSYLQITGADARVGKSDECEGAQKRHELDLSMEQSGVQNTCENRVLRSKFRRWK
jgi:hypothetical protein